MPAHPKFRPEFVEQARVLTQLGATDNELADFFKVATRTIHAWKVEHPEFGSALKVGKLEADERVKRALYHNALGYTDPDGKHYRPDTVACIFWLKNRQPEQWRENFDGERIDKAKLTELLQAVEGRLAEIEEAPASEAQRGSGAKQTH